VNEIKRTKLAKHIYFSPCINFNDITYNPTTRIELAVERKKKNTSHITLKKMDNNPNITQRVKLKKHINMQGK
jgi:hypothetical protein